jgi:hypothetical protein
MSDDFPFVSISVLTRRWHWAFMPLVIPTSWFSARTARAIYRMSTTALAKRGRSGSRAPMSKIVSPGMAVSASQRKAAW